MTGHSRLRFAFPIPAVGCGISLVSGPPPSDDSGDAQLDEGAQIEPYRFGSGLRAGL